MRPLFLASSITTVVLALGIGAGCASPEPDDTGSAEGAATAGDGRAKGAGVPEGPCLTAVGRALERSNTLADLLRDKACALDAAKCKATITDVSYVRQCKLTRATKEPESIAKGKHITSGTACVINAKVNGVETPFVAFGVDVPATIDSGPLGTTVSPPIDFDYNVDGAVAGTSGGSFSGHSGGVATDRTEYRAKLSSSGGLDLEAKNTPYASLYDNFNVSFDCQPVGK